VCLSVGHSYESNVVRSAKRVAYFGQVLSASPRKELEDVGLDDSCDHSVIEIHVDTLLSNDKTI